MAKIFCVANQKGGVGKTTTTVNLAAGLAKIGQRVLMVDLDPQGNATMGSNLDKRALAHTVYDVLWGEASLSEARQKAVDCGYDVLGANRELAGAEVELVSLENRERRLKDAIASVDHEYDFVLIDCPPSLGLLTLNAFVAADAVLVPLQCEFYALEGLSMLLRTVERVRKAFNPGLDIQGVVLTMFDVRNNLSEQVAADVREHLGEKVYRTVIPRNVRVSEAPSHGLPVLVYDMRCAGSKAYIHLASEVIKRERGLAA